jgi:hypothetical protein
MLRAAICLLVLGCLAAGSDADGPKKKARPKFTIAKDTTLVTGPLAPDGTIDYETALNERLSKGIKAADNANVLLWSAIGPRPYGRPMPAEYFKWLGVPAPPKKGEYFSDLLAYLNQHHPAKRPWNEQELYDLLERLGQRPWTAKEHPHIAAWLKANAKSLASVGEATGKPHYYSPLVSPRTKQGASGLYGALHAAAGRSRELAQALTVRAMGRVGEGRFDEAWQDLLACHRLGRLVSQGGTLLEELTGIAIDRFAYEGDLGFLEEARLDASQVKNCLRDLQKLPALAAVADKVNLTERFMLLETIMMINRYGFDYLDNVHQAGKDLHPPPPGQLDGIDWDPALRTANRWYDRLVADIKVVDRADRKKQLKQFERDWRELWSQRFPDGGLAKAVRNMELNPTARGQLIGNVLVSLMMPAVWKVVDGAEREDQLHRNLHVAFALAAYQREHGGYPKNLEALAPAYLAQVPSDQFSGKALIYRPAEGGYLLYSVGVNGRDEQGRSSDDEPPGDDLTIRMPLARRK